MNQTECYIKKPISKRIIHYEKQFSTQEQKNHYSLCFLETKLGANK